MHRKVNTSELLAAAHGTVLGNGADGVEDRERPLDQGEETLAAICQHLSGQDNDQTPHAPLATGIL